MHSCSKKCVRNGLLLQQDDSHDTGVPRSGCTHSSTYQQHVRARSSSTIQPSCRPRTLQYSLCTAAALLLECWLLLHKGLAVVAAAAQASQDSPSLTLGTGNQPARGPAQLLATCQPRITACASSCLLLLPPRAQCCSTCVICHPHQLGYTFLMVLAVSPLRHLGHFFTDLTDSTRQV